MLFFGHIGLTLLAIFGLAFVFRKQVDYRLIVVGALLPDLIDKPLGHYLLGSVFQNGRIYSHTLAFLAALAVLAFVVAGRYRYWGVVTLAVGALFHQVEDEMWKEAGTWLWPLYGWGFPRRPVENYFLYLLSDLFEKPWVYVPELIGLGIVAAFVLRFRLYSPGNLKAFLWTGHLPAKTALKPDQPIRR